MDDSRLPKKVMYSVLPKDYRTCVREDLKLFKLATKDNLDSWLEIAKNDSWSEIVLDKRGEFMDDFFEVEDCKSNKRAFQRLPFFPYVVRVLDTNRRALLALPFFPAGKRPFSTDIPVF